ncbi:hypothetical protein P692DRAFT_201867109 [Suillus brevipes Sb2]|nr:hypothetical protein P692DRAFT_201867109 [Suillus brevipes Sb2]
MASAIYTLPNPPLQWRLYTPHILQAVETLHDSGPTQTRKAQLLDPKGISPYRPPQHSRETADGSGVQWGQVAARFVPHRVVDLVLVLVGRGVVVAVVAGAGAEAEAEAGAGAEAVEVMVEVTVDAGAGAVVGAVVGAGNQTVCNIIMNLKYLSPAVVL